MVDLQCVNCSKVLSVGEDIPISVLCQGCGAAIFIFSGNILTVNAMGKEEMHTNRFESASPHKYTIKLGDSKLVEINEPIEEPKIENKEELDELLAVANQKEDDPEEPKPKPKPRKTTRRKKV